MQALMLVRPKELELRHLTLHVSGCSGLLLSHHASDVYSKWFALLERHLDPKAQHSPKALY